MESEDRELVRSEKRIGVYEVVVCGYSCMGLKAGVDELRFNEGLMI